MQQIPLNYPFDEIRTERVNLCQKPSTQGYSVPSVYEQKSIAHILEAALIFFGNMLYLF